MPQYNILASMDEATVVSEYTPQESKSDAYQSEAELEQELIEILQREGYEYLQIHSEKDLIANLRAKLEELNDYRFTDDEWDRFFHGILANPNSHIIEKTRMIQRDNVQVLIRDDGTSKNITLIDKKNIHRNRLQVINQYVNNAGTYNNRYDDTILVNGFPMVHMELKRRGVAIKEAFNQIDRYQRDSFWAASGLYEYVQIFVISNGTHTKYYSNTTRDSAIREGTTRKGSSKKTSNSFEFTSFWADANNRTIPDLVDFAHTFLAPHTILNIITRYCVLTSEDLLLVMRPYQITATERILNRILIANNYHWEGTIDENDVPKAGGYVWHTTGSGKTLTSFKTAQIASDLPFIDKVLFVVDRQDLDYQTMKEYDRFEKGCADSNTSTAVLEKQMSGYRRDARGNWAKADVRIIITTIQKLSNFVVKYPNHPAKNEKIVLIFDECHRSQFGDMHKKITKFFRKYFLFGFTGTPIFAQNASKTADPKAATTPQLFGGIPEKLPDGHTTYRALHTYTIVDAINDGNVLPFRIDYVNTMRQKDEKGDNEVYNIDRERAMRDPARISEIVAYVLDHFDQKTKAHAGYTLKGRRVRGFNSIFACASQAAAKAYYTEFRKQIRERGSDLKVATIFTYAPNEELQDNAGLLPEEDMDTSSMDQPSRDFLDDAIHDYNLMFHTNFDTSAGKFGNYYKDISMRMKNRDLDLLIVVDMFLTGFDATTLNTLWVDKNLRQHGLLQAFSRTNRILNSVKTYGNIICFRNLQKEVDDSIALFGDKNAASIILLKDYRSYYKGYDEPDGDDVKHHPGYEELVTKLLKEYPLDQEIRGEKAEKDFIATFGSLLRVMNILTAFDQFEGDKLLTDRQMQDYQSNYIDLYQKYKPSPGEKADIHDDVVFEMELVKQIEVNIDYILALVQKYHDEHMTNGEWIASIMKVVDSSTQLRSKKALIEAFLHTVNVSDDVPGGWKKFVNEQKEKDFQELVTEERLKRDKAREYVNEALATGNLKTNGTVIDDMMPPVSRFGGKNREGRKQHIIDRLKAFFEKYFGV